MSIVEAEPQLGPNGLPDAPSLDGGGDARKQIREWVSVMWMGNTCPASYLRSE